MAGTNRRLIRRTKTGRLTESGWHQSSVVGWAESGWHPSSEGHTGVWAGFFTISTYEFLVLPLVLLLAILAGLLPAAVAYRTDVSRNLAA